MFIYPIDTGRVMSKLRRKVTELITTKRMQAKQGLVSDPQIEAALIDAEKLRMDLQTGSEKLFHTGVYFTLYSEDSAKLKTASQQLETILGGQLVMTRSADFRMERCSETTLPQCTDMMVMNRNMNTSPLSCAFPFANSTLTSHDGILYGLNRHNNSLVIFDRFNLENANSVVFSKSGGGKSYAVKLEILRSLMMGTDVIVIDPENEYRALTQTVGGTYVNISLSSEQRINPFDLPNTLQDHDVRPGDIVKENIINLIGLLSLMLGGLTPLEEGLLDKALLQTYAIKGITLNTPNPASYQMPTMNHLYHILMSLDGRREPPLRSSNPPLVPSQDSSLIRQM